GDASCQLFELPAVVTRVVQLGYDFFETVVNSGTGNITSLASAARSHHARRELWSLSLLSRIVSATHGRVGRGASRDQSCRRRSAPPLYKMLEQVSGAGASIRRSALAGSYGTSWTAKVDAGTEPSFRMMCRWPLPESTSVGAGFPGINAYTREVCSRP